MAVTYFIVARAQKKNLKERKKNKTVEYQQTTEGGEGTAGTLLDSFFFSLTHSRFQMRVYTMLNKPLESSGKQSRNLRNTIIIKNKLAG
jgi:hypothetical protein